MLRNAVEMSHILIALNELAPRHAIDATCGNGNDTEMLATMVGVSGKVFAFDIQSSALEKTRKRLLDKGLEERVKLIASGHENLLDHISEPVQAVMFNLGYLPGGDHQVVTRPDTTIKAVECALGLMEPGALMTIVVYPGHEGGNEEYAALAQYLKLIPQNLADVVEMSFINQINQPAILYVLAKRAKNREQGDKA